MHKVLVLYAHPAQRHSNVNAAMAQRASQLEDVSFVDLYAEYPRFKIDTDREQQRLRDHEVLVLQFPLMWYSTPSLLKEWIDLVLEYGFAYGDGGTALAGKTLLLACSAGSAQSAYYSDGFQQHSLTTLLSPLLQTGNLCGMQNLPPYVLFDALGASEAELERHSAGYCQLLRALRDGQINPDSASGLELISADSLPQLLEPTP